MCVVLIIPVVFHPEGYKLSFSLAISNTLVHRSILTHHTISIVSRLGRVSYVHQHMYSYMYHNIELALIQHHQLECWTSMPDTYLIYSSRNIRGGVWASVGIGQFHLNRCDIRMNKLIGLARDRSGLFVSFILEAFQQYTEKVLIHHVDSICRKG